MKVRIPKKLTVKEQKSFDTEINRQLAVNTERHAVNICSIYLWQLRKSEHHGPKRLRKSAKDFARYLSELQKYYLSESAEDTEFYIAHELKEETGITQAELAEMLKLEMRFDI